MSDRRVITCYKCGRAWLWTSISSAFNFGPKGVQACPYCWTEPRIEDLFPGRQSSKENQEKDDR